MPVVPMKEAGLREVKSCAQGHTGAGDGIKTGIRFLGLLSNEFVWDHACESTIHTIVLIVILEDRSEAKHPIF